MRYTCPRNAMSKQFSATCAAPVPVAPAAFRRSAPGSRSVEAFRCIRSFAPSRRLGYKQKQRLVPVAAFPPHQFAAENFHRLQFYSKPYGPVSVYQDPRQPTVFNDDVSELDFKFAAVLGFRREEDAVMEKPKVLELFIAGDSAINVYSLLTGQQLDRPMAHDLMYLILQQAQVASSDWKLLRVAITEVKNEIFIGRAFFGDPVTGEIMWDCDCRPSDGCFLSIKAKAPFYVHRDVWDSVSRPAEESTIHRLLSEVEGTPILTPSVTQGPIIRESHGLQHERQASGLVASTSSPESCEVTSLGDYMEFRPDDLDEIKLLKKKLALAVGMEDYRLCAELRDHPWMQLYREAHTNK
eukprot:gene14073-20020_t